MHSMQTDSGSGLASWNSPFHDMAYKKKISILVAEGNETLAQHTIKLLRSEDYHTIHATAGKEAMTLAEQHQPKLILLGENLPDVDSFSLYQQIKSKKNLSHTFTALFTASLPGERDHTISLKPEECILRPIADHELLARIGGMLRIQRAESALKNMKVNEPMEPEPAWPLPFIMQASSAMMNQFFETNEILRTMTRHVLKLETNYNNLELKFDIQRAMNELIMLFFCDESIETLLTKALKILLTQPWLASQQKGAIFLVNDNTACLSLTAHINLAPEIIQLYSALNNINQCICDPVFTECYVPDCPFIACKGKKIISPIPDHEQYCVPIIAKNKLIGFFIIFLSLYKKEDMEKEITFLTTVAQTLAGIIIHKKAEERLKISETSHRSVLEAAPDPIVVYNADYIITYVNPAFESIFGWSAMEASGRRIDLLLPGDWPKVHNIIDHMMEKQTSIVLETQWCNRYGQTVDMEVCAALYVYYNNQTPGTIVTFRDISDRKELEKMYLEKEAAEAANMAKSKFLANMSHELRTPLNAVIGFTEVLRDKHFGPLNEKQENYLQIIEDGGRHLLSLINDVLDLSKIEAGKIDLELSRFPVTTLLLSAVELISENALRKNISIHTETAHNTKNTEIIADSRIIKQIMYNILSNAVKFTPTDGNIQISIKKVSLYKSDTHSDFIKISIKDTGIGLNPEDKDKIFEEFYQVKSSYTDKTPGTGLGLSLAKKLVELHNGILSVESEGLNKGSKFTIVLPTAPCSDS